MVKTLRSVVVTKQVSVPSAMKYDRYGRRNSMRRDRRRAFRALAAQRPDLPRHVLERRPLHREHHQLLGTELARVLGHPYRRGEPVSAERGRGRPAR